MRAETATAAFFLKIRPSTGNDVTADPPDIKILKQC